MCGNNDTQMLREHGMNCEHAESGREALELMRLYDYDLMLVDLELPDMKGSETVRLARAEGLPTPSIVLAGRVSAQVRMKALDEGADGFITTPCDPDELVARVRAVIRRGQHQASAQVLRLGPIELCLERHQVTVNGQAFPATRREFSVLESLGLKPGIVLSKSALLKSLYGDMEEPGAKAIDVIICRLRKKLALVGVSDLIVTDWGNGYVLNERPNIADNSDMVKMAA
jgi:two-component system cell cycle response regulator CtrA